MNKPNFFINHEIVLVEICIKKISDKLMWGDIREWKHGKYVSLSDSIFKETAVSISVSTLKRIYGKSQTEKETYEPQIETKNAMARFIGYESWEAFLNNESIKNEVNLVVKGGESSPFFLSLSKKKFIIGFTAVVIICGFFIIMRGFVPRKELNIKPATFNMEESNGDFPFTIKLDYNISSDDTSTYWVDFGDHLKQGDVNFIPNEKNILKKEDSLLTHCYTNPDFYRLHVYKGDSLIFSKGIHVFAENWVTNLLFKDQKSSNYVTEYLRFDEDSSSSFISKGPGKHVMNKFAAFDYWTEYKISKTFLFSDSSFTYTPTLRNNRAYGGKFCFDEILMLSFEQGDVEYNFIEKGCERWVNIVIGEKKVNGRNTDLQMFTQKLSDWNQPSIQLNYPKATIFFNEKEVYNLTYERKLGRLKSIKHVFKGNGQIKSVKLEDSNNDLTYYSLENFN